jgi:hypothetical protein
MGSGRRADASRVLERLQELQAEGYGQVALGPLLVALVVGLLVPPASALLHELGHALVARRCGLLGVTLPRVDRRRFAARYGFGLTRLLSARDPRGWVRLDPAVPPRQAVAIVAAGPAVEAALSATLLAAAVLVPGTLRAVLCLTALDCAGGAAACLLRRESGYGDGVALRWWLNRTRRPAPTFTDPNTATSVPPPS